MQAVKRGARFRVLIALAAVAVPLAAAGQAHAAMAGANPATTGLRPDLRSAQITKFDSSTGATTIQVCFDKQIASVPTASLFRAGSYRSTGSPPRPNVPGDSAERAADSATRDANGTCANVVWSSSFLDPQQRTYVTADSGAVANVANGQLNLEDSVALNGSNSHNGTRGHAVAPDLEGITINQATLTVNYIMDEPVAAASPAPGAFAVMLQNGAINSNPGGAGTVTTSGNVVSVKYSAGQLGSPGNPVVQGIVHFFTVFEATQGFGNTTIMSAAAPGTGGLGNNPDLIAVTLSDDGTTADFTFDENVSLGPEANKVSPNGVVTGSDFAVVGSDSLVGCTHLAALTGADIVGGNTVRVPLTTASTGSLCTGGGANNNEYMVWGFVNRGVVTPASLGTRTACAQTAAGPPAVVDPTTACNAESGVPVGGNAGAFANGFTAGPDAFSTTFNASTGVVGIRLDQRFAAFVTGDINLVDDAGALIPGNPTTVSGAGGPAGPVVASAQFTPGQVAGAKSLLLDQGAFTSNAGYANVDQDLSPTATAKRQHKHGHVVRHKMHGKVHANKQQRRAAKAARS